MKRKLVPLAFVLAAALTYLAVPPTAVEAYECQTTGNPICSQSRTCKWWFFKCSTTYAGWLL